VLEITEVDNIDWDITGLPAPQAPATVELSTRPGGAKIEAAGGSAEVSISPDLEIPFTSVSDYQIGTATLPTVGTGWGAPRPPSNLPLGLVTALPVLLLALHRRSRRPLSRRKR